MVSICMLVWGTECMVSVSPAREYYTYVRVSKYNNVTSRLSATVLAIHVKNKFLIIWVLDYYLYGHTISYSDCLKQVFT